MSRVRILATTLVTLSHTFTADELPTDAAGAVTATVKRLDATAVASGTASHDGVGIYSYPVTRAVLDTLTVDWSGTVGGSAVTVRDIVEVCGGFLFGLAEARDELKLSLAAWPTAKLAAKRLEVEQECERICRQAFVPRFAREALSGNGTEWLATSNTMLRTLRAVTVDGVVWSAPDVAALGLSDSGTLTRPGGMTWPSGVRNVVVEYEHGLDTPPTEISDAGILRLRSMLSRPKSGIPDRTASYTDPAGGVYRLSLPTRDTTGIPDVDGPYLRYTRARRAVVA
jgi:hypothetical protein